MSLSFGCSAKISLVGGDTDQAKKAISKKYPQRFLQLKDKEVAKSRIDLRRGLNLLSGHRSVGHFGHNDTMTQAERSSTDDTDTTNHQPSPRPQTTVISGGGAESFYRTPSIDSRPSIFNGGLLLQQASLGIREKKTMDLSSQLWGFPAHFGLKHAGTMCWEEKVGCVAVGRLGNTLLYLQRNIWNSHAYGKPHSQCWAAMVEIYLEFLQQEC